MNSAKYRLLELLILFVLLPVSFLLDYSIFIKVGLTLIGFVYVVYVLKKHTDIPFKIRLKTDIEGFWKPALVRFCAFALLSTGYVWWVDASQLFCVPLRQTGLWVSILLFYSLVSVWPQEVIYRAFFFSRYESLFRSQLVLIFFNAVVFSLAHLFFLNGLVTLLTFLGGILFSFTYTKTRSTLLVSLEHALYGNWLFTVGMGEMLAFPGMEACQ